MLFFFLKYGTLKNNASIVLKSKNEVCLIEIFGEIFQKFRKNFILKSEFFGINCW